jgi:hypothetical protein
VRTVRAGKDWGKAKKMESIIEQCESLRKFFNTKIESTNKQLYEALLNTDSYYDLLRQDIDSCCEIAIRYDLVSNYENGQLRGKGYVFQESIRFELRVARLFEKYFGKGCLNWDPQGTGNKLGDFILNLQGSNSVFVEIKTKETHSLTEFDLRNYSEGVVTGILQKAYCKVPLNTPFLTILCNDPFDVDIDELQIKRAYLGLFSMENGVLDILVPGFCSQKLHTKLSAIGHYYFHIDKENLMLKEYFNVYHNPNADLKIANDVFEGKCDKQFPLNE